MSAVVGHLSWLSQIKPSLKSKDGRQIQVWELRCKGDQAILSSWAKHFREHYCLDSEIDKLRAGTGFSREAYLTNLIFPDGGVAPGPSIRAGDFAEILVSDYLEYRLAYWVPRWRYAEKAVRNESVKGTDIVGIRLEKAGTFSPNDELLTFEVKAQLSTGKPQPRLQAAINDSVRDNLRKAYSLNAIKRRLFIAKKDGDAQIVERFQNATDRPYKDLRGAAAVFCTSVFDAKIIAATDCSAHPKTSQVILLVIRGNDLMDLANSLFTLAAHEA